MKFEQRKVMFAKLRKGVTVRPMVICESCRGQFVGGGVEPLSETNCGVCGRKGVFIPETERLMTYEL